VVLAHVSLVGFAVHAVAEAVDEGVLSILDGNLWFGFLGLSLLL